MNNASAGRGRNPECLPFPWGCWRCDSAGHAMRRLAAPLPRSTPRRSNAPDGNAGTGLKRLPSRISCRMSGCPRHSSLIGARSRRPDPLRRSRKDNGTQFDSSGMRYSVLSRKTMNPIHSSMHVSVTLETEDKDRVPWNSRTEESGKRFQNAPCPPGNRLERRRTWQVASCLERHGIRVTRYWMSTLYRSDSAYGGFARGRRSFIGIALSGRLAGRRPGKRRICFH